MTLYLQVWLCVLCGMGGVFVGLAIAHRMTMKALANCKGVASVGGGNGSFDKAEGKA